jgi:hypothetical protein
MQDIENFFQSYRGAWLANSASQIESFWDTSEPTAFYKAEEIQHIMTSWDDLRAYWKHNEGFNTSNELNFSNIVSKPMGDDRILAGTRMRWDIAFADDARNIDGSAFAWAGKTMGGENHVMACLKQVGGNWKLTSWVEAPDAPIMYMADLYMNNVRPDFPAT